jgi:multiple sugar transport system ATP-binding protein
MSNVILKNVKKTYDNNKVVINSVNLEIKDKEFVVLVGSSGCGKSTLLRMIAGLENITDGEIFIGDKKVNDVPPKDRDIAFVFQSYALYPHMTVRENIAFGLKMRKVPKAEIEKKVQDAAQILNLTEYLDRKPKQLSGGQRQRVALGRAIVRNPKVFLMDEPLSNLDAKLRVQMRSEIKKLHEKLQTTFIYVTHDQTEALTMGDRIVLLNNGDIQQADSPDEVYNNPKNTFVAGFIGSPQMNFIDGKDLGLDENILYGIRPEKMVKLEGDIKLTVEVDISEMLGSE